MTGHVIPDKHRYRIYLPRDESLKDLRKALRKERHRDSELSDDHLLLRTDKPLQEIRRLVLRFRLQNCTFERIAFNHHSIFLTKAGAGIATAIWSS